MQVLPDLDVKNLLSSRLSALAQVIMHLLKILCGSKPKNVVSFMTQVSYPPKGIGTLNGHCSLQLCKSSLLDVANLWQTEFSVTNPSVLGIAGSSSTAYTGLGDRSGLAGPDQVNILNLPLPDFDSMSGELDILGLRLSSSAVMAWHAYLL